MKLRRLILVVIMIFTIISSIFIGSADYVDEDLAKAQLLTEELFKNLENTEDIDYVDSKYLKGLDDANDYILTEREGQGYAIYEKEGFELIEFSINDVSPYISLTESEIYYGGPSNYFKYKNNSFYNLSTNKKVKDDYFKEIAKNIKKELKKQKDSRKKDLNTENDISNNSNNNEKVKNTSNVFLTNNELTNATSEKATAMEYDEKDTDLYNVVSSEYIDGYQYFLGNQYYVDNVDGTCTAIAVQLLLGFNNWYFDGRLIPANPSATEQFLLDRTDADRAEVYGANMKTTTSPRYRANEKTSFYEVLLNDIGESSNPGTAKTAVDKYIDNYVKDENLKNNINHNFIVKEDLDKTLENEVEEQVFYNTIDSELSAGRPMYCSIHTYNTNGDEAGNHAIVVYGKTSIRYQNQIIDGYVANFGWVQTEGSNIWINKNWIFRCYYFRINHTHYDIDFKNYPHIKECIICGRTTTTDAHSYVNIEQISNWVNNNIIYDTKYHYKKCSCGYKSKAYHVLNKYQYIDERYHKVGCECGYELSSDLSHFYKGGSHYCFYCGYYNAP